VKITMKTLAAGPDYVAQPGDTIDVPAAHASAMVAGGYAEHAEAIPVAETAEAPDEAATETAEAPETSHAQSHHAAGDGAGRPAQGQAAFAGRHRRRR
jgi:hypothetical protein